MLHQLWNGQLTAAHAGGRQGPILGLTTGRNGGGTEREQCCGSRPSVSAPPRQVPQALNSTEVTNAVEDLLPTRLRRIHDEAAIISPSVAAEVQGG